MSFTIACVQTNSQNVMSDNIAQAISMIEAAHAKGAELITLPENVAMMSANADELLANVYPMEQHPAILAFQDAAKRLGVWILAVVMVKSDHEVKVANRSIIISDKGTITATYDKIHLYDASVPGGETHQESRRVLPGNRAVAADTPWCKLGMTICYDVRFPHLYRFLAKADTSVITVPAAFTEFTGKAHWHVLLRARAIETGCFIVAPAQTGAHPNKRHTYGHSLIVDPWGTVLADGGEAPGIITAKLDLNLVTKTRQALPCLEHDREFV